MRVNIADGNWSLGQDAANNVMTQQAGAVVSQHAFFFMMIDPSYFRPVYPSLLWDCKFKDLILQVTRVFHFNLGERQWWNVKKKCLLDVVFSLPFHFEQKGRCE